MKLDVSHLPHPLAILRIRAANEKSPRGRHYAAYLLWEAGLRLLAAVLLAEFQHQAKQCRNLSQPLDGLKRPSTGHWRAIVRELLPVISDQDSALGAVANRLGAKRVVRDMPAAAALSHAIERQLRPEKGSQLQSTVRLSKLFDDIVSYRTDIRGHGGLGEDEFFDRMSKLLLAGLDEIFLNVDVLCGRDLIRSDHPDSQGMLGSAVPEWSGSKPNEFVELAIRRDDDEILPISPWVYWNECQNEIAFFNGFGGGHQKQSMYLTYVSGAKSRRSSQSVVGLIDCLRQLTSPGDDQAWIPDYDDSVVQSDEPHLKQLGDFQLLELIGEGGMGRVYRAFQPSLERIVALKVMRDPHDSVAVKRFDREIQSLAKVDHPNLVKIYDSGTCDDDYFYTMEYVQGADLSSKPGISPTAFDSKANREEIRQIAKLMMQVARAIEVLNRNGVIHRDIKPANIMIDSEGDRAVLLDLGLAHQVDNQNDLTRTQQFVGTLRYSSPEQAIGKPVDSRSDVYSLGATFWELLTGRRIFDDECDKNSLALTEAIVAKTPDSPDKFNRDVPTELSSIVLKSLEKDPSKRYESAAAFTEDLSRWFNHLPVQARQRTVVYRARKFVRREFRKLAIVAIAILIAIGVQFLGKSALLNRQVAELVTTGTTQIQSIDLEETSWKPLESTIEQLRNLGADDKADAMQLQFANTLVQRVELDVSDQPEISPGKLQQYENSLVWLRSHGQDTQELKELLESRASAWKQIYRWETGLQLPEVLAAQSISTASDGTFVAPGKLSLYKSLSDETNVRLSAEFAEWPSSRNVFGFEVQDDGGVRYGFVLRPVGSLSGDDSPSSFLFHLQMFRNQDLLSQSVINLNELTDDRCELHVELDGYELSLQLQDRKPLRARDYFRALGGHQSLSLSGTNRCVLNSLQVSVQAQPVKPSIIQQGDLEYARGDYTDAIEIYRAITHASHPDLYPQAEFKIAQSERARGRQKEALKSFRKLFDNSRSEFSLAAGCYLWRDHMLKNELNEADKIYDMIETSPFVKDISRMLSYQERLDVTDTIGADVTGLQLYFVDDQTIQKLRRRLDFGDIVQVRYEISSLDMRYLLHRAYLVAENDTGALELASELIAFDSPHSTVRLADQGVVETCWLLRVLGNPDEAEQWLADFQVKRGHWSPELVCERVRILRALGRTEEAYRVISELVRDTKVFDRYRFFSHAWALKGFLEYEAGKQSEALQSWKSGTLSAFASSRLKELNLAKGFNGQESLYALVMESLSCQGDRKNMQLVCEMLSQNPNVSNFLPAMLSGYITQQIVPSTIRLGQTDEGRETLKQVVFQELRFKPTMFRPLEWLGTDYVMHAVANAKPTLAEKEQIEFVLRDLMVAYGKKQIGPMAVAPLGLAWKSPAFGSGVILKPLTDKTRPGMALILALRALHFGQDASAYLQLAKDDPSSTDAIKVIAEQRLNAIKP